MTGAWEPLEVEPQYPQHLKIINKGGRGGLGRKHTQQAMVPTLAAQQSYLSRGWGWKVPRYSPVLTNNHSTQTRTYEHW